MKTPLISIRRTECGSMRAIIIEGVQSAESWDPSQFRGDRVCGDQTDWKLSIIDGGGGVHTPNNVFMRKQQEAFSNKVDL